MTSKKWGEPFQYKFLRTTQQLDRNFAEYHVNWHDQEDIDPESKMDIDSYGPLEVRLFRLLSSMVNDTIAETGSRRVQLQIHSKNWNYGLFSRARTITENDDVNDMVDMLMRALHQRSQSQVDLFRDDWVVSVVHS